MPRLFEQGDDVQPIGSYRVASGKIGTPTINHSWDTIKAWLQTVLNFLTPGNNLSDIDNPADARNNLGVLSSGDTMTAISNAITNAPNISHLKFIFSTFVNGRSSAVGNPAVIGQIYTAPEYSGITLSVTHSAVGKYLFTHNLDINNLHQMFIVESALTNSTIKTSSVSKASNHAFLMFGDDATPNDTDFYVQFFEIVNTVKIQ